MQDQDTSGDSRPEVKDSPGVEDPQAVIDERLRLWSEKRARAKIGVDFVRVLAWPTLVGIVVAMILQAIEQQPRCQASTTAATAHLTTYEQRRRLDEDLAVVLRHRNDAAPAADIAGDDIRERMLLSEDLAMRRLGAQHDVALSRQVTVGNRPDLQFDGVFEDQGGMTLVEVKYVIDADDLVELVDAAMAQFERAGRVMTADRSSFLLVLVADMPEDRRNAMTLQATGLVGIGGCRHRVCVYGFDQLREQYGVKSEP